LVLGHLSSPSSFPLPSLSSILFSTMKSVNRVTLLGNVTRDPEVKNTANGQAVCTFGLATNRVWKDATGEKQSLAEYHNLVAWGGLAEFCGQNVRKGKPLYVEGYLKTRSWDGPEGTKIFRTEIVVENIVLLGPRDSAPINSGSHDDHTHDGVVDQPLPESSDMLSL
jgi:single-strand DNA-binding protein